MDQPNVTYIKPLSTENPMLDYHLKTGEPLILPNEREELKKSILKGYPMVHGKSYKRAVQSKQIVLAKQVALLKFPEIKDFDAILFGGARRNPLFERAWMYEMQKRSYIRSSSFPHLAQPDFIEFCL